MTKQNSLRKSQAKTALEELIRVNHAGEYGAKRIYQGQLSILKSHKEIGEMLEQELKHLEYFENEIKQRRVRPTILQPLWHMGGFALGAITALMSEEAAMACTVAVEEVIGNHYNEQLKSLSGVDTESALSESIQKFRDEELEHMNHGIEAGAENAVMYGALKTVVSSITKAAIVLSKKF